MSGNAVLLVLGLVVLALGILAIRFARGLAKFFYSMGSSLYGEKLATRTYTPINMRIAGAAWIALGCLMLVLSMLSFAGIIHSHAR